MSTKVVLTNFKQVKQKEKSRANSVKVGYAPAKCLYASASYVGKI